MTLQSQDFDPARWLMRDALSIREIFALMRGKNPSHSRAWSEEQDSLAQALKDAVDCDDVRAHRLENGRAFVRSLFKFKELIRFAEGRKHNPFWNPPDPAPDSIAFYRFCKRWEKTVILVAQPHDPDDDEDGRCVAHVEEKRGVVGAPRAPHFEALKVAIRKVGGKSPHSVLDIKPTDQRYRRLANEMGEFREAWNKVPRQTKDYQIKVALKEIMTGIGDEN